MDQEKYEGFYMQSILITGGAGYIGSVLIPKLLNSRYKVTVLDNFLFNQNSLFSCSFHENFSVVNGDCRDKNLLKQLIKSHDIIIPLAALVGAPMCNKDEVAAETVNYGSIQTLCELLAKDQYVLMPVSNSGYGIGENGKFCDENSPLNPISLYGRTKVDAEKVILDHGNSTSFRLATVFGSSPRMRKDLLVNDFTYKAFKESGIIIFEGHFKRNFIHIQDVTDVFLYALNNKEKFINNVFNVGLDDANLSKLELCAKIKEYLPNFVIHEAEIGEDPDKRDYIVSNKKLISQGFVPKYSLDFGIKELIKLYTMMSEKQYSNV
jgi:nucleoside-diphosphate-sugar epimerase